MEFILKDYVLQVNNGIKTAQIHKSFVVVTWAIYIE